MEFFASGKIISVVANGEASVIAEARTATWATNIVKALNQAGGNKHDLSSCIGLPQRKPRTSVSE